MSSRVLPARGRSVSGSSEAAVQTPCKILPFPAPIFASFAEAERHSAPAGQGNDFLLGVVFAFAFEMVAALLLFGVWHLWKFFR